MQVYGWVHGAPSTRCCFEVSVVFVHDLKNVVMAMMHASSVSRFGTDMFTISEAHYFVQWVL